MNKETWKTEKGENGYKYTRKMFEEERPGGDEALPVHQLEKKSLKFSPT